MDVRLSPEQQALRAAAAQLVDRLGPGSVGALSDGERVTKLDAALAGSGWRELRAASDGAVPLASGVEAALVAEELGRGLADTPFLGPTLAADLRRRAGAPPGPPAETVLLSADATWPAVVGGADPAGGVAMDVGDGAGALVLVPDGDGWRPGRLALEGAGTRVDLTRRSAVPALPCTVEPLEGAARALDGDDVAAWVALGLALTCADLVGVMRGAVALARDYAVHRHQYDAPIGSFQAVQHLLADAHVAAEGSCSIALHAAWAVDALPPAEALAAGASAKAYCTRAALQVCETAVQVHGGIGNTWDCLAHVFLRRALVSGEVLGGVGTNLERVLAHHGLGAAGGTGGSAADATGGGADATGGRADATGGRGGAGGLR